MIIHFTTPQLQLCTLPYYFISLALRLRARLDGSMLKCGWYLCFFMVPHIIGIDAVTTGEKFKVCSYKQLLTTILQFGPLSYFFCFCWKCQYCFVSKAVNLGAFLFVWSLTAFFLFLSLSSFLLSLLSSMFSYLIYGTGIPVIALVGFCLYFSGVLAFDLCFFLCLISLPASQKQIWNFVVKITFVFQCSWYVLSPNLPVS